MITRRGLITGLVSLAVARPAIVRASSLMPVRVVVMDPTRKYEAWILKEITRALVEATSLPAEVLLGVAKTQTSAIIQQQMLYEKLLGSHER